jgi:hypothetical protein
LLEIRAKFEPYLSALVPATLALKSWLCAIVSLLTWF